MGWHLKKTLSYFQPIHDFCVVLCSALHNYFTELELCYCVMICWPLPYSCLFWNCVFIQVHIRVASPPIRFPCYMGINIPTKEELIANRPEFHDLANYIGKCYFFFFFLFFWERDFSCRCFIVYIKIKVNTLRQQWQNWLKNHKVDTLNICIVSTLPIKPI